MPTQCVPDNGFGAVFSGWLMVRFLPGSALPEVENVARNQLT